MGRFSWAAIGETARVRGCGDRLRELGASSSWPCCVLLISVGLSRSAIAQETVTYIHTDALGSVVAESDANGNVIKRYDYEPYGAAIGDQVTDGPGYTGHVSDSVTGLSYMQQRYYDPQIGRFLSVDPVAANPNTGASFNRYNYAMNNPYRFTDPDGRDCVSKDKTTTCSIPVTGSRIPTKISFATPPGVSGTQKTGSLTSHVYNRSTPHQKSDKAAQRSMVNDPTPDNDKPASPTGTAK